MNLPKGRKRGASKGTTEPSPKNSEGNIRPQIHTNLDTYSSNDIYSDHKQGIPSNFNRPTTSYGLNTDSGAGENNGRFRVINPPTIETSHDNYPSRETATFKKEDDNEIFRERGENKQEEKAHIRLEDEEGKSNVIKKEIKQPVLNTKTKANDSEDEYEEDFELSESLVPDQFTSKLTKMSQSQKKDGVQSSQEKKKNDALFAETTISMDFEKEFDSNYLKNLDNKLSKYK